MIETVFTAQALTKTYTSGEVEVRALRGLDLELLAGEVVVLLGPSGIGKSTLLNIMGGLDQATSGRLFFKDLELTGLNSLSFMQLPSNPRHVANRNSCSKISREFHQARGSWPRTPEQ